MQSQPTANPLTPTRSGVLVVDGYGVKIRVERGHLVISDGIGRARREGRFARATHGVRRLALLGHSGFVSLEAIRWLTDVGIGLVHLDPDGRMLVSSAGFGLDDPRLRRAQAAAFGTETGMTIARGLIRQKLSGQARVAREIGGFDAVAEIGRALDALDAATTPAELMMPEAAGASAYWSAWAPIEISWAKKDVAKVPSHWRNFGGRASPLTGNPRLAANPPNSILNYLMGLAESGGRLACLASGLDPGLGVLHADLRARDSLVLDVIEAVRPDVDSYLLEILRSRTFRMADFVETRQGHCRIAAPLTHELAATLPVWEARLAPVVEAVARAFAAGPDSKVRRMPTLLTGANRSSGRDGQRRRAPRQRITVPRMTDACRTCGRPTPSRDRRYCDSCLPEALAEQQANRQAAATAALIRMRDDGADRSHGGVAALSRGTKVAAARREATEWERESDRQLDPDAFRHDVLPGLKGASARRLSELTGLSRPYCSAILRGSRVPHPRHWETLRGRIGTAGTR